MNILIPLSKLSQWHQVAFSCALLERMLPNYQMFSENADFGDASVLRNQLSLIWQWLDKNNRCKINYQAQITKLDEQIPDPQAFDFFGVYPALDASMALLSLLQVMQDKDDEGIANVVRLSINSVASYVELLAASSVEQTSEMQLSEGDINQHPLMVWEKETQQALLSALQDAPENKNTCMKLRELALSEGLSNLGIEIA